MAALLPALVNETPELSTSSSAPSLQSKASKRRQDEVDENGVPWWVTGAMKPSQVQGSDAVVRNIADFVAETRARLRNGTGTAPIPKKSPSKVAFQTRLERIDSVGSTYVFYVGTMQAHT